MKNQLRARLKPIWHSGKAEVAHLSTIWLKKSGSKSPVILVIGPAPGQAGGISSVMSYLETQVAPRQDQVVRFIDTMRSNRWSVVRFLGAVLKVAGHIARARFAGLRVVVHLNVSVRGSTYRKWLISRVCKFLATPYVFHLHGGRYPTFFAESSWLVRRMVLALIGDADRVIVLGSVWREFVVRELRVPDSSVAVVPNGTPPIVRPTVGLNDKSHTRVIFSGRIDEKKGINELLQAADALHAEGLRFELVLMGDSRDPLLLEEANSRAYCNVTGWLAHDRMVDELAASDIFVLPSHDEGLPMALVEAMSLGIPVIVTRVGAIPDVVEDGQEGYLIEPHDSGSLLRSLRSLIHDESLRADMGRAAYSRWRSELGSELMSERIVTQWRAALEQKVS